MSDEIRMTISAKRAERAASIANKTAFIKGVLSERMGEALFAEIMQRAKGEPHEIDLISSIYIEYEVDHPLIGPFLIQAECDEYDHAHLCIIQNQNVLYFYDQNEFTEQLYLLTQIGQMPSERKIGIRRGEKRE